MTTPSHWHHLSCTEVAERLRCNPAEGLNEKEVVQRRIELGDNTLPQSTRCPLWSLVTRQFVSPLIYILFVAAVISAALGHVSDALVILTVVAANAIIFGSTL